MTCPVLANSADPDQLASEEANRSGSALFVIKYVNFYQKPGSSILTAWLDLLIVLIVLGFNDTSTLEGHFVSSPREREKRDRRESRGDDRERDREERGTGMKVKKQKK